MAGASGTLGGSGVVAWFSILETLRRNPVRWVLSGGLVCRRASSTEAACPCIDDRLTRARVAFAGPRGDDRRLELAFGVSERKLWGGVGCPS